MAKKSKFGVTFEGFDELMTQLDGLEGDLKQVTTDCLEVAHETVTPNVHGAMRKHHQTGATEKSIKDNSKVTWEGSTASIDVGFKISDGGLPSIFLMYGTPKMKKDTKLYNSIYGKKVRDEIAEKQQDILNKAISKRLGG